MRSKSCYVEIIVDVPAFSKKTREIIDDSKVLILGVDHPKMNPSVRGSMTRIVLASDDVSPILEVVEQINGVVMSTRFRGILDVIWWVQAHQVDAFNRKLLGRVVEEEKLLSSRSKAKKLQEVS